MAAVLVWVDLAPRVDAEFFFSDEDPQLRATTEIGERFPSHPQIIVRAESSDVDSEAYESAVRALTASLAEVEGIASVASVTSENARRSPLWGRLLLNSDGAATNLVLQTTGGPFDALVPALQSRLAAAARPDFGLQMSGVPVIVELIRSSLFRDLVVFSSAALLLFGLLIGVVYRRVRVVLGTLVTCLLACSVTLILNQTVGLSIGLLTANIVTIVFVLTLSHIVFLTANASRFGAGAAVGITLPASFWAMATTLLGFFSLTVASARPLRELGMAGAMGTVVAIVMAYGIYPAFLTEPPAPVEPSEGDLPGGSPPEEPPPGEHLPGEHLPGVPRRLPLYPAALVALTAVVMAFGLGRLDTDPGLLSYFAPGSELREGLETIDRDGGSSTLEIVVRDGNGAGLDVDETNEQMWSFQDSLEADPTVGVVVSPPVLFGHARQQPLASFLTLGQLAEILESPALDQVGRAFLSADRMHGRFFTRMHETERAERRRVVIERLLSQARLAGLEPVLVGGVYDLQDQLGRLIASSLRIGLGGLLLLFIGIAYVVARSWRTTVAMFGCLVAIPVIVLGAFGHLSLPVDMITSPAANVALALGVDSMIHLVLRFRALDADGAAAPWAAARTQMTQPVLAASLIVCAGFGIFALSTFPPTARFGFAVILGTVMAATVALAVLPSLAQRLTPDAA